MLTEQSNTNTLQIDQLDTLGILQVINGEDKQVADAVATALPAIADAVDAVTAALGEGGRLIYVGAGTSGRLGIMDAVECIPTFSTDVGMIRAIIAGGPKAIVKAVEGAEDDVEAASKDLAELVVRSKDVVVGITASGHTPYVLAAVNHARSRGAGTVGLSCNVPAPLLDAVDIAIGLPVGPEVISGSTRMKAGTAQKMVLNMLSTAAMIRLGKVYGNLMVDLQVSNDKLEARAINIISQVTNLDSPAARKLLYSAEKQVKIAIIMQALEVNYIEAQHLLNEASGHLSRVI